MTGSTRAIYQSDLGGRFFVSSTGGSSMGVDREGYLIDLRRAEIPRKLKFGSVLNHCPYDDWQPFQGSVELEEKILARIVEEDRR